MMQIFAVHRPRFLLIGLAAILTVILPACQSAPRLTAVPVPQPDAAYEAVEFASADGTPLRGYLFHPSGSGPFPAVVALHGCAGLFLPSGHMSARDLDWGKRLAAHGYLALYPDSFTPRHLDQVCTREDVLNIPRKVRPQDARGALRWLAARKDVQLRNIALMGWSNGGSSLLWSLDRRDPAPDPDFKTAIAFYPGCVAVCRELAWSNRIPIHILMGEKDNWTSPQACLALQSRGEASGPIEVTLYPDSYHDFDSPDMPLRTRHGLAHTAGVNHTATLGTNPQTRLQAIEAALEILNKSLKP